MRRERPAFGSENEDRLSEVSRKKQVFWLKNRESEKRIAQVDVYPNLGFYSAHWESEVGMKGMLGFVEKALIYYENKYPKGVPTPGKVVGARGIKNFNDPNHESIIIISKKKDGQNIRQEFVCDSAKISRPYERPLKLADFKEMADNRKVIFIRLNTNTADFVFDMTTDGPPPKMLFGVLSNALDVQGFAPIMHGSAPTGRKDAELLFSQAVNYFQKESIAIR